MLELKKGEKLQTIFSGLLINFPLFSPSLSKLFKQCHKVLIEVIGLTCRFFISTYLTKFSLH